MQIDPTTYHRTVAGAIAGLTAGAAGASASERAEAPPVGFGREEEHDAPTGRPRAESRTRLLGAADALPGQGEPERVPRLDELLSARSILPPITSASERPQAAKATSEGAVEGPTEDRAPASSQDRVAPVPVSTAEPTAGPKGGGPAQAARAEATVSDPKAGRDGEPEAVEEAERTAGPADLSGDQQDRVEELEDRDREVRQHEQAHIAAGGQYVRGGATYEYENGPDGKRYAVGGEVSIDTSTVAGDPEATIKKAQQVRRSALAPAEPSSQDRRVAAAASRMEAKARQELAETRMEEMADGPGSTEEDEDTTGGVAAENLLGSPESAGDDEKVTSEGGEAPDLPEPALPEGAVGEAGLPKAPGAGSDGEKAGPEGVLGDLKAGLDGLVKGEASDGPRTAKGLDGPKPGEKIEKVELIEVDGNQKDGVDALEPPKSAAAAPPTSRLDYGARPSPGQVLDIYG